ncbi:HTH-type transcriptional regulator YesS [Sporomusa ovata DSM 2662]|uniref:Two-component response regulator yesN n=1 Tax=Sporomusa ovata TaxID=2378 RepID=A0A0U1L2L4_9FIRM|nr:helix-turn-helix domain-containing protein [Sporomusa ovata]EQB25196.1 transcriptional regulatory protein [Sporomusa ovata DSM 2662]CQR73755.1 Two-component response regulator yesN [Sporomusa ovata]
MYTENIAFDGKSPVIMNVYNIGKYTLHCHEDVIEIIFVLKGEVQVKVSFEYFTLSEGDYVVVNREDSHKIWQHDQDDNIVAVFHVDLKYYQVNFPHIYYVIFACESFDLAKYKGQSYQLRQMLLDLMNSLLQGGGSAGERTADITARLVHTLVKEYSLERYYNRHKDISSDKLETYYTIIQYIYEQYHSKTLLQDISAKEFYSKSYISHIFKEVGAASFQDILGYIRVYKAERLLLETDDRLTAISGKCGFSDIKYFNRTFQKWFLVKPTDYRKIYQQQIGKASKLTKVADGKVQERINHFKNLAEQHTEYKVSITPITLKNIGSQADLLSCLKQDKELPETADDSQGLAGNTYAVIRMSDNGNLEHNRRLLEKLLNEFQDKTAGDIECWFIK